MMHKVQDLLVINVHTIHKCLYLIHTKSYKLLSGCDLLWPSIFNRVSMTGEVITGCHAQIALRSPGQGSIFYWPGQVAVISSDYCHTSPKPHTGLQCNKSSSCHRAHSHTYDWQPLSASVETKSVLFRSSQSSNKYHQYATLRRPNKVETTVCGSSVCFSMTGEVNTGCHKYHLGPHGHGSIFIDQSKFG